MGTRAGINQFKNWSQGGGQQIHEKQQQKPPMYNVVPQAQPPSQQPTRASYFSQQQNVDPREFMKIHQRIEEAQRINEQAKASNQQSRQPTATDQVPSMQKLHRAPSLTRNNPTHSNEDANAMFSTAEQKPVGSMKKKQSIDQGPPMKVNNSDSQRTPPGTGFVEETGIRKNSYIPHPSPAPLKQAAKELGTSDGNINLSIMNITSLSQQVSKVVEENKTILTQLANGGPINPTTEAVQDEAAKQKELELVEERQKRAAEKLRLKNLLQNISQGYDDDGGQHEKKPRWRYESEGGVVPSDPAFILKGKPLFRAVVNGIINMIIRPTMLINARKALSKPFEKADLKKTMLVYRDACESWLGKLVKIPVVSLQKDSSIDCEPHMRGRGYEGAAAFDLRMMQLKVRLKSIVTSITSSSLPDHILKFLVTYTQDNNYFESGYLFSCESAQLDFTGLKATKHMIPLGFHDTYALLYPESAQWDATNERPNSTIPPRTPIKYTHNPSTKCAADGSDLAKPTATTEGYANDVKTRYKKTFFRVKMMIQNFLLIRILVHRVVLTPWHCGLCAAPGMAGPNTTLKMRRVTKNCRVVASLLYMLVQRCDTIPSSDSSGPLEPPLGEMPSLPTGVSLPTFTGYRLPDIGSLIDPVVGKKKKISLFGAKHSVAPEPLGTISADADHPGQNDNSFLSRWLPPEWIAWLNQKPGDQEGDEVDLDPGEMELVTPRVDEAASLTVKDNVVDDVVQTIPMKLTVNPRPQAVDLEELHSFLYPPQNFTDIGITSSSAQSTVVSGTENVPLLQAAGNSQKVPYWQAAGSLSGRTESPLAEWLSTTAPLLDDWLTHVTLQVLRQKFPVEVPNLPTEE